MSDFTLPSKLPQMKASPIFSVPMRTMIVAVGPRPCSICASMTVPRGVCLGAGFQFEHFGFEQDAFEQFVDALALDRGDRADADVAAPILGGEALFLKLAFDLVQVRAGHVDLGDGDDDLDLRGLGVIQRLDRLRHDAVIGRDDEHDDVGDVRAAGAHRGEGGVAGGVEESDAVAVVLDAVSADVLRDAAGFARGDARLADRVHERGLAVIDMAHEGDDRRAQLEFLGLRLFRLWRRLDDCLDPCARRRLPCASPSRR